MLELRFREKGEAIGGAVVNGVSTGIRAAKRLKFLRIELVEIVCSGRRTKKGGVEILLLMAEGSTAEQRQNRQHQEGGWKCQQ